MNEKDPRRTWVVMPAYNAEQTLERTFFDIPERLRHQVLLVDDCSTDRTVEVARALGLSTPILICRNFNRPNGILFYAVFHDSKLF
jgi:glycosyltransferase involved in cell wall biosynthesis